MGKSVIEDNREKLRDLFMRASKVDYQISNWRVLANKLTASMIMDSMAYSPIPSPLHGLSSVYGASVVFDDFLGDGIVSLETGNGFFLTAQLDMTPEPPPPPDNPGYTSMVR